MSRRVGVMLSWGKVSVTMTARLSAVAVGRLLLGFAPGGANQARATVDIVAWINGRCNGPG